MVPSSSAEGVNLKTIFRTIESNQIIQIIRLIISSTKRCSAAETSKFEAVVIDVVVELVRVEESELSILLETWLGKSLLYLDIMYVVYDYGSTVELQIFGLQKKYF